MPKQTLLEQLESARCLIDLDSYDPEAAKAIPFTPHDATCNTFILGSMIEELRHRETVIGVLRESSDLSPAQIFDKLHAVFASRIIPHISGWVYAQTSSKSASDVDAIIAHATALTEAYDAVGIGKDRVCIKIPTTSAGVQAAVTLKEQGIETLATAIFGLPQAIAASQAKMHAISPYFNAIIAFIDSAYWPDVADPASEHPMARRYALISREYAKIREAGGYTPEFKGAGYVTGREVMAQGELGCDHVTVMPTSIADLLAFDNLPPYRPGERDQRISNPDLPTQAITANTVAADDPLKYTPEDKEPDSVHPDYLASGVLDAANEEDPVVKARLANALAFFVEAEDKALAFIEQLRSTL